MYQDCPQKDGSEKITISLRVILAADDVRSEDNLGTLCGSHSVSFVLITRFYE